MAGITKEIAEARLTAYLDAEARLIAGHLEVEIDGERFRRVDLEKIQAGIDIWNARVQKLNRTGGLQVREVIPR